MKKHTKILSLLLAVLMIISVSPLTVGATIIASGTCGNNLTWEIDDSTSTLIISGTGDMYNFTEYGSNGAPWYKYRENFINVSFGDDVTSIGDYAFYEGYYLESIELGKSIKAVGYLSFNPNYQTITVNPENPYLYIDENGYLLSADNKILHSILKYQFDGFVIPDGVVEITSDAFCYYNYNQWTKLYFPASLEKLDLDTLFIYNQPAFFVDEDNSYFSSDEYGALFNKNKTIIYRGSAAVSKAIYNYTIPETVTEIADYAFYSFEDYVDDWSPSVEITKNVKKIGKESFTSSGSEGSIFIPLTVDYIDPYFNVPTACNTQVYYEGTQAQWEQIYSNPGIYVPVHFEHSKHVFQTVYDSYYHNTVTYCIGCNLATEVSKHTEHDWVEEYRNDPSCGSNGNIYYYCTICGEEKSEIISATGQHVYDYWIYNHDATCTEDGTKTGYCERCDASSITITAEGTALGHNYNEWIVLSEVSCSQDGIKIRICKNCSEIDVNNTKAYGHFDDDADGRCDDCSCLLEYTNTDTPDEPDSPDTPEEQPEENRNIFAALTDFFNRIIDFIKKVFRIK